jgi:light-regulated signal transduction histidine kinase (bacteriophytochrome)
MANIVQGAVDLADCAREPIHVPGFIQSFGVLLAMRAGTEMVTQISNNARVIFGQDAVELVGQRLHQIIGREGADEILNVLGSGNWKEANPIELTIPIDRAGKQLAVDAIVHRYDGLDFVELEIVSPEATKVAKRSYHLVQAALLRMQQALDTPSLFDAVVSEAQRLTGYDRAMLYKFDRDDHGHVIAERKQDHQGPFLGLHYPASDIPEQARRLYRVNWVRYIPDVRYQPVPLIPVVDEDHARLTDLSHSVLRSVSPVHCEYLRNMGVAASMSVSILREGRLWGLIALHNDTPRYIPYQMRAACELLGQVLSLRIAALEDTEDSAYKSKTNALQARLLAALPEYKDLAGALVATSPNLLDFIPATGAAVLFGDKIYTLGKVPDDQTIRTILRSTLGHVTAPIFVTDRLQDRMIEARSFTATASGVTAFTASRARNIHVFWFRTEQVQIVEWGGEPTKPVEINGEAARLSPRKSFDKWKQEVYGKSQPWLQTEIEAAAELRATLMSLLLEKSTEA